MSWLVQMVAIAIKRMESGEQHMDSQSLKSFQTDIVHSLEHRNMVRAQLTNAEQTTIRENCQSLK